MGISDRSSQYSSKVFEEVDSHNIDCVLIDGRFRVACALQTILNINNPDAIILFHDIWNRKGYHIVLKYLVEIERVESTGVFKIYHNTDRNEVVQDYEKYKYNPL